MNFPFLEYTPQLYYYPFYTEDDKQKVLSTAPKQVGSCVLFKTDSEFFLITAKHIFEGIQISDIIIFLNDDNPIRLPMEAGYFIPLQEHDNRDILIIKISIELSLKIKSKYSFLPYKNIDFRHLFSFDNVYMLLGFINKQTISKMHEFLATPFGFFTTIKHLKKIEEIGFNYFENITLRYNRRKQSFLGDSIINLGPKDLKGLSGGGIWYCHKDFKNSNLNYCFLVGIMIEERTNRGIIIGTKINLALEILYHRFGILSDA